MKLLVIITFVNKSCTLMLNTGNIVHKYYQLDFCLLIILLLKKIHPVGYDFYLLISWTVSLLEEYLVRIEK